MAPSNAFEVNGRTAVITGGSSGMGLCVARQLAEKGASIVIVARNEDKLLSGIAHIKGGALSVETQRFHHISADLASPSEAVRVIDEVVSWNSGNPPDIVWCCAGGAHPTLFIDTPVSEFPKQMNTNYFTALYMAHAALRCWLVSSRDTSAGTSISTANKSGVAQVIGSIAPRHLIFTASFVSFFTFAGYSPYSPGKAALRSLSDSLSQEMNLYAAANPREPRVRVHTIFPATILTEGLELEDRVKTDLTKLLEEGDTPQTPEAIATKSIQGLESGQEIITTDFQTGLVRRSMLGGSTRGGFLRGLVDWFLAGWLAIIMVFVRGDMDSKVQKWGREFGASGMKSTSSSTRD
ncbi:hypothetical protein JX265_003517 [Neoarthrinium moseri]|uniref:3-dehydrosphinganine reductase n=1 Tax=Neoarthrinium moseri TaxID=1658444 RepID=A0A9P9WSC7_9PEZI|nr:hypothetical protein JX266_004525 [Neoarthrinium moseri]KAI1877509.1 hypothetical protein JX265_003517 [Neoarthrinium moseri]